MDLSSPQNLVNSLHSTPRAVESPRKVLSRRVARSRIDTGVGTREDVTEADTKAFEGEWS